MNALEASCQELLEITDSAVACGVLDLDSGQLLAMRRAGSLSSDSDDVFASAVADIFFNASVAKADEAVRGLTPHRISAGLASAQEILIATAHSYQFAARIGTSRAIVLLVAHHEANVGLARVQLRAALPRLQEGLADFEREHPKVRPDPVQTLISQLQATAKAPDGTLICGQLQRPSGLVLLDDGLVSWATARAMKTGLAQQLCQNAVRPVPPHELKEYSELSRREGRPLGESLLAAGFLDEDGMRRSYLAHCATALVQLSQDSSARPLTWRAGSLMPRQSPFRFSMDELLVEARSLTAAA